MRLEDVASLVGAPPPRSSVEVKSLAYDSRAASPGALFICLRGRRQDGHGFAAEAVASGAVAVLCEETVAAGVPELVVADTRAAMNLLAAPFYGHPSRQLKLVGITGTNGKTTTAYLIDAMARASGDPSGLIATIERRVGDEAPVPAGPADIGTPESPDLQRLLRRMVDAGVGICAADVTSIGIQAGRIEGCRFEVAVFTNLTRDHLDHHSTMEDYYLAKRDLFRPERTARALVNIDDPFGARLAGEIEVDTSTYAIGSDADFRAVDIQNSPRGSRLRVVGDGCDVRVRLRIPGAFNHHNALAAVASGWMLGLSEGDMARGIEGLAAIPGRFELIEEGQDFTAIVDFAHSPDSLAKALEAARSMATHKVLIVFGAEGSKDRGKRPLMGAEAARRADRVFVTSDNPKDEDPQAILRDVEEGLRPSPPPDGYLLEADRGSAIGAAVREAGPGDVVLVAGKGHETHLVGRTSVPFDDREVLRRAIRERLEEGP